MSNVEYQSVESSNVSSIGYLENNLYVMFKNGSEYVYKDVPESMFNELLTAKSVGSTLNNKVKGVFDFERIA